MASYTLANISTPAGTLKVTLISSIGSMTAPTENTIIEVGELIERIEDAVGSIGLGQLTIRVKDIYSTYTEGFWFKVANDATPCELLLLLDEGAGDTYFFYGVLDKGQTVWDEHYISSSYVRSGELTFNSYMQKLESATIADLVTEIASHEVTNVPPVPSFTLAPVGTTGATTWGYKIRAIYGNGISAQTAEVTISNGNANLGSSDKNRLTITLPTGASGYYVYRTTAGGITPNTTGYIGTGSAATFEDTGLAVTTDPDVWNHEYINLHALIACMVKVAFAQAYSTSDVVQVGTLDILPTATTMADADLLSSTYITTYWRDTVADARTPYLLSTDAKYWGARYNCKSLLGALAVQFGFVPRYYYDTSASKHRIKIYQRGTGLSTISAPSNIISSRIYMTSDLKAKDFIAFETFDDTKAEASVIHAEQRYDLTIRCEFVVRSGLDDWDGIFYDNGAVDFRLVTGYDFWKYSTGAYTTPSGTYPLQAALVSYYADRFGQSQKMIEREYATIKSGTTHANLAPLCIISVNDGTGATDFYINEVRKDVGNNRCFIQLVET